MYADRPKTILHVITRLSLGGSAVNTLDSASAAARAGYRTIVAVGRPEGEIETPEIPASEGCRLELISGLKRNPSPLWDLLAWFQILRVIRRYRPDIVHTHTSKAGFLGRLAAFVAGTPVVIHTPHGHVFYAYHGRILTALFVLLERFAALVTDYLVFLTEGEAREHWARGIGRPEKAVTIPSGVDLEALTRCAPSREQARRWLGWSSGSRVVLGIGRLVRVKGFDLALRALAEALGREPALDLRLVLVGEGPEREALAGLAAELGIARQVCFVGASSEVPLYLAASDLLVAPSRNEGQGRALVEAMAMGLPVVATRVGGIPSVLRDGECGLLVPPESAGELARAILELSRDEERRRDYHAKGLPQCQRFSLPVMESELLALYRRALDEKGIARASTEEILEQ